MYGNTVRMNDSKHRQCFGGHSERETPGHIPNPEAKTLSADGTAGVTLWESRTPPDFLRERATRCTSQVYAGWPFFSFKPPLASARRLRTAGRESNRGRYVELRRAEPPAPRRPAPLG